MSLFLSFLAFAFAIVCFCDGNFDFDELQDTDYGINIMQLPKMMPDETDDDMLVVTSIHGQPYECSQPDTSADKILSKQREQEARDIGVTQLLQPLAEGPCLTHTRGWWTYELCYKKSIKQYHLENGRIAGNVIELGLYKSDYSWEKDNSEKDGERVNRYHSQDYENGSMCDLTEKPRSAQVRYFCEESTSDHITHISEPETCVYTIQVRTPRLCAHPQLKPKQVRRPITITCQPLLSQEEYDAHMQEQERVRELQDKHQKIFDEKMRLKTSSHTDTVYRLERGALVAVESDNAEQWSPMGENMQESLTRMLSETLQQLLTDKDTSKEADELEEESLPSKNKDSTLVLTKSKEAQLDNEMQGGNELQDDLEQDKDPNVQDDDFKQDGTEQDEFVREFESELRAMSPGSGVAKQRERIQAAVKAQFQQIMDEANAELAGADGTDQPDKYIEQLSATLDKLMDKVDDVTKEMEEADETLAKQMESHIRDTEKKSVIPGSDTNKLDSLSKDGETKSTTSGKKIEESLIEKMLKDDLDSDELSQIKSETIKTKINGQDVEIKVITTGYIDKDGAVQFLGENQGEISQMLVSMLGTGAEHEEKRVRDMEDAYNFTPKSSGKSKRKPDT